MLADTPITAQAGRLDREVQLAGTARYALLDFIAEELPRWRDYPGRPAETSETALTGQLCGYLTTAAHRSPEWSWIQFRTELADEIRRGRRIDLAPTPCGAVLVIEGCPHAWFDMLFPIECKRLPTPKKTDRDEREYVVTAIGTTGGIQRFKFGYHGAKHCLGAMIAYVQDQTFAHWIGRVNCWIESLAADPGSEWSLSDRIEPVRDDIAARLCTLRSCHRRAGLNDLELRHLWMKMN
jgi:hypothetical protein